MKRSLNFLQKQRTILEKLEIEFLLIFLLISFGVILMHNFEWLGWFDSLYFNIVTLAGIWYGDIVPKTIYGKTLAIVYGLIGIPLFIIAWTLAVEIIKWRNK